MPGPGGCVASFAVDAGVGAAPELGHGQHAGVGMSEQPLVRHYGFAAGAAQPPARLGRRLHNHAQSKRAVQSADHSRGQVDHHFESVPPVQTACHGVTRRDYGHAVSMQFYPYLEGAIGDLQCSVWTQMVMHDLSGGLAQLLTPQSYCSLTSAIDAAVVRDVVRVAFLQPCPLVPPRYTNGPGRSGAVAVVATSSMKRSSYQNVSCVYSPQGKIALPWGYLDLHVASHHHQHVAQSALGQLPPTQGSQER